MRQSTCHIVFKIIFYINYRYIVAQCEHEKIAEVKIVQHTSVFVASRRDSGQVTITHLGFKFKVGVSVRDNEMLGSGLELGLW